MIVQTERIILRELCPEDVDTVWLLFSHPEILKTTIHCLSQDRCCQWIERQQRMQAKRGFAVWGVALQADQRLIGYCGLGIERIEGNEEVEIGYRILPEFWGQGLATEAAIAVLRHGLTSLQLQRIIATVLARNAASLRVVEKSGMRYEKDVVIHEHNMRLYAADAQTWRAE